MNGIEFLVSTAERSHYQVRPDKYTGTIEVFRNAGNFRPVIDGCNPTYEAACQVTALDTWRTCSSLPKVCAQQRDFSLAMCALAFGCAPGNSCTPDAWWGALSGFGTCCPTGQLACAGFCYAQCTPPKYFDGRFCECRCPPVTCTPPYVLDLASCSCKCPPQLCFGGKQLDQSTCICVCPPPLKDCNGHCTDTQSAFKHCGTCNNPCATGEGCCSGVCTPLTTDQNCGVCGKQCTSGSKCCNRNCTQLGTSSNCGDCGDKCVGGHVCQAGKCVCPAGQIECGPSKNCCPTSRCCNGYCCPPTEICCNGSCVNILTSSTHCGGCNQPCSFGKVCVNGMCVCPAGQVPCGPMATCTAPNLCCNNIICSATQKCCGGQCVDTQTNNNHCGGCNQPCPPGATCVSGICVAPTMMKPCNAVVKAGNNLPVSAGVELGKTSGTFSFTYSTRNIPDKFMLWYQGQIIYNTGCISTGGFQTGLGWPQVTVPVSYTGSSTQLLVQVVPNCSGISGGGGTEWEFTIGCP